MTTHGDRPDGRKAMMMRVVSSFPGSVSPGSNARKKKKVS